jgi:hypothetical protein
MTSRTAQRRKAARSTDTAGDPLEKSLGGRPRCECKHSSGRCRRRATHRVSAICVAEDCDCAVHVYLACAECKDGWLHHASHDPTLPELRVTPL